MRRALVTLGALGLAVAGWFWLRGRESGPDVPSTSIEESGSTPPVALDRAPSTGARAASDPSVDRRAGPTSADAKPKSSGITVVRATVHVIADDDEEPIAGATLSTDVGRDRQILGTTGADGRATVDVPFAEGRYARVEGAHPGFVSLTYRVAESGPTSVRLWREGPILGRVVLAATGEPVAGARIFAFREQISRGTAWETTTNAEGRFALSGESPVGKADLVVRAPGHATAVVERAVFGRTEEVVVVLQPGGELAGTVTDASGRPLAGIPVTVAPVGEHAPRPRVDGDEEIYPQEAFEKANRTMTDAHGRYRIAGLPLHTPSTAIAEPSAYLLRRSEPFEFDRAGESETRDLRMPRPGSLQLTLAGLSEDVWRRATLHLVRDGAEVLIPAAERRPDGSWLLDHVAPGPVRVEAKWMVDTYYVSNRAPIVRVAVVVESRRVDVVLAPTSDLCVEGQVVLPDGTPAVGARLNWREPFMNATADLQGKFKFTGMPPGPGTLDVSPRSDAKSARISMSATPGGEPLRVVLPASARLVIQMEGDPHPLEFSSVSLTSEREFDFDDLVRSPDGTTSIDVSSLGVPLRVSIRMKDTAPVVLDVEPMQAGEVRRMKLAAPGPGRTVDARVLDEADRPLRDVMVAVMSGWFAGDHARTDAKGDVRLARMAEGDFFVTVDVPDRPSSLFVIPAGLTSVTLRLAPEGTLVVIVTTPDGKPASGASISSVLEDPSLFSLGHRDRVLDADESGVARGQLQSRVHRLAVRDRARLRVTTVDGVVIRPGETTTIDVRLP